MTTGPDNERRPPEPSFADVMNGFSFDSGRSSRPRRWGRRRNEQSEAEQVTDPRGEPPVQQQPTWEQPRVEEEPEPYAPDGGGSSVVRPYTWTRGRTRSGVALEIETLVSTSTRGREQFGVLQFEHRSVAELCDQARSVAEVAALLAVPLGVAKVLVGDMAGLGLVVVHQTVSGNGDVPDLALMERVLSGLRRL
ncbi:MAG TPA: DUF742 domain-containing protein [Pseudonocardia sp.]|jgi:hypothetical protein|nr:DUF742 domain-containing protein [Pseudonocardia sp.]